MAFSPVHIASSRFLSVQQPTFYFFDSQDHYCDEGIAKYTDRAGAYSKVFRNPYIVRKFEDLQIAAFRDVM